MSQAHRLWGTGLVTHHRTSLVVTVVAILVLGMMARQAVSGGATPTIPNGGTAASASQEPPSYARDVSPVLQRACVRCHGPDRADKGLRLDSYRRALAGDSYGAVLIPGKSSLSAIVSVVKYGTMPHDGMRLPPEEIGIISRWIDAGAPEN